MSKRCEQHRVQRSLWGQPGLTTPSELGPQLDQVFRYDKDEQKAIMAAQPWKTDPHHFKKVRISAVALIKMVSVSCRMQAGTQFIVDTHNPRRSCTQDPAANTKLWD